jgi:hypothetical protein
VINVEKLKNLSLFQTTVSTWPTSAKGTGWLINIHLVGECESGQKLFFCLLNLTVPNSDIILLFCSSIIDHRKFHLALVQNLLEIKCKGTSSSPPQDEDHPIDQ